MEMIANLRNRLVNFSQIHQGSLMFERIVIAKAVEQFDAAVKELTETKAAVDVLRATQKDLDDEIRNLEASYVALETERDQLRDELAALRLATTNVVVNTDQVEIVTVTTTAAEGVTA
jgi:uncharacterized protein YlxW (UPF0749 family)